MDPAAPERRHPASPRQWSSRHTRVTWLLVAGAVSGVVLWRLGGFVVQPLDAAGTLRPWLLEAWTACIAARGGVDRAVGTWRWLMSILGLLAFGLAALNLHRRGTESGRWARLVRRASSGILFAAVMGAALLLGRFPVLLLGEINVDESQFIAAAHQLLGDPVFFRAADTGTSGPLNIYPLLLPVLFGLSPDYASSRLVGLLLIGAALWFTYRTLCVCVEEPLARFLLAPIGLFFASMKFSDFLHYSSEHMPMVILAWAFYLTLRFLRVPERQSASAILLGVCAAAAFFSKMQALPIVLACVLVCLLVPYAGAPGIRARRVVVLFALGAGAIGTIVGIICLASGAFDDLWTSYGRGNLYYADAESEPGSRARAFWELLMRPVELRLLLFACIGLAVIGSYYRAFVPPRSVPGAIAFVRIAAAGAAMYGLLRPVASISVALRMAPVACALAGLALLLFAIPFFSRSQPGRRRWPFEGHLLWVGLAASTAALLAVYLPNRDFGHYLLLLVLPLGLTMAGVVGSFQQLGTHRSGSVSALLTIYACATLFIQAWTFHTGDFVADNFRAVPRSLRTAEGDFIHAATTPGGRIFVWGWEAELYLESGRIPATPDTNIVNLFAYSEMSEWYRDRFLNRIRRDPPEVFVDSVGPASWAFPDRHENGHEVVPALKEIIDTEYVPLVDERGRRLYLRLDIQHRLSQPPDGSCDRAAVFCLESPAVGHDGTTTVQLPVPGEIEVAFTSDGAQQLGATVIDNDSTLGDQRGLMLRFVDAHRCRLLVGTGNAWIASREILTPPGVVTVLRFGLEPRRVRIHRGEKLIETLELVSGFAVSPDPIVLGSRFGRNPTFRGRIHSFSIWQAPPEPPRQRSYAHVQVHPAPQARVLPRDSGPCDPESGASRAGGASIRAARIRMPKVPRRPFGGLRPGEGSNRYPILP